MKQRLFFLALFGILFSSISVSGQNDLDFAFKTPYLTVYTQRVDSFATEAAKKAAKPGTKVENIIARDTVVVNEGGLRYVTKNNQSLTVYNPNNPKDIVTYSLEFAGWIKGAPNPIIKYNMIDKDGSIFGIATIDLFSQEFYLSTPNRQILYRQRL